MPPEMLEEYDEDDSIDEDQDESDLGYDFKADVWSAGVLMCFVLLGNYPYQSSEGDNDEVIEKILGEDKEEYLNSEVY